MSRQIKTMLIDDLQSRLGDARDMLVVDCSKLDAITANKWRLGMRESNITALTVKNSIARNALAAVGVSSSSGVTALSRTFGAVAARGKRMATVRCPSVSRDVRK